MGDYTTVLEHLNLSPINTLLLAALVVVIRYIVTGFEKRIAVVEAETKLHAKSISWIKGHIEGEEED